MAAAIETLPPELLEYIFSYLSDEPAIGACRLTSRTFTDCSTPFLVTTVVVAKRLKALNRMLDIINHPVFYKHITKLVFDGSWYEQAFAEEFYYYVQECERAPRNLKDGDWNKRRREDDVLFSRINRRLRNSQKSSQLAGGANNARIEHRRSDDHSFGYAKTWPDYCQLHDAQSSIQRAGSTKQVLVLALEKLPKLRTIVLSDWRALAKLSESYDACASRLFGKTLAPTFLTEAAEERDEEQENCLRELLTALEEVPSARIENFVVGSHPYESPTIPLRDGRSERGFLNYPKASTITHLCLPLEDYPTKAGKVNHSSGKLFQYLLSNSDFPHLQSLDLGRWVLPNKPFRTFLAAHAESLQELRLLQCFLAGDVELEELGRWAGTSLCLLGVELNENRTLNPLELRQRKTNKVWIDEDDILQLIVHEHEKLWLAARRNTVKRLQDIPSLESTQDSSWYLQPPDRYVPKRYLSAYILFAKEQRERVRDEIPGAQFGDLGKLLGQKWKALNDEQRAPYEAMAAQDRKRYEREKAAYVASGV